MQWLMRAAAVTRTHFDGDAVPFGVYTAPAAAWVSLAGWLESQASRPQAGLLLTHTPEPRLGQANFSSLTDAISAPELEAECPASLLNLPPDRCNEGAPPFWFRVRANPDPDPNPNPDPDPDPDPYPNPNPDH